MMSKSEKDQSISTVTAFSSAEPARVLVNYYKEFSEEMPLVCPKCHWTGAAKDGDRGEHKDVFDVSCPKCSKMLLVVPFPTGEQVREAAAAGNVDAMNTLPNGNCQTNLSGPCEGCWSEAFRPPADATRPGRQNGSV